MESIRYGSYPGPRIRSFHAILDHSVFNNIIRDLTIEKGAGFYDQLLFLMNVMFAEFGEYFSTIEAVCSPLFAAAATRPRTPSPVVGKKREPHGYQSAKKGLSGRCGFGLVVPPLPNRSAPMGVRCTAATLTAD